MPQSSPVIPISLPGTGGITTVPQSSPVIPLSLPGTGGSRSHNSMKISYNDQYIMNKNNYILLVHLHKK